MVKQKILNKLDSEPKGFSDKIAKLCSYSNGSALRKVLLDPDKEFGKFSGLVKAVQTLFPDEERQIMTEYALSLNVKNQTARFMLEYCEVNKLYDVKKELIKRMKNCSNLTSKEWADIYEIDDLYFSKQIDFMEAINKYNELSPKSTEAKVALKLYKSYCFLDKQMHDMIFQVMFDLESLIIDIKEEYIKDVFLSRYRIFLIENNVKKANIEIARKLCLKIIETSNDSNFKAWSYLHLGNSYIYEGYSESMKYFEEGLSVAKPWHETAIINIKRSITFTSTLWNEDSKYFDLHSKHASDVHEIAFYYIRFKQYTNATSTLDKLVFEDLNENQRGFHMLFRGLISKKMEDFTRSITHFRNSGDSYFRRLPLIELEKMGVDNCIIEALSK